MLEFNFTPFPILTTARLVLREVTDTDVNEVFALRSNPELMKYIPRPLAKTNEDALMHIEKLRKGKEDNDSINWAITLKDENKMIGIIGFVRTSKENHRGEVGYMLHHHYHGKGIMQEALTAVIDYGFKEMNFHTIEGVVDPRNNTSAMVLEKNGFVKEAHFKENFLHNGEFLDSVHYTLFKKS
jgi:[ribosomal protein S5]-alanine N-acetyltransferase